MLGGSRKRCQVWGVLNVTPDSFSDGGEAFGRPAALAAAKRLLGEGADVLDVGGASSRPAGRTYGEGAASVSVEEELARVVPVIEQITRELGARVSIDTTKPEVAAAAIAAGASIVNDTSNGTSESLLEVVARSQAQLVLMHNRGDGRVSGENIVYRDIVNDVMAELSAAGVRASAFGVRSSRVWIDPGLGFAKTSQQSVTLLAHLPRLLRLGYPALVGASRKSFISEIEAGAGVAPSSPQERLGGSAAAVALSVWLGASAVRVHDVRAMRQTLLVTEAIQGGRSRETGAS